MKGLYNNSDGLEPAIASNKAVLQLLDGLVLFLTQSFVVLQSLWLGLWWHQVWMVVGVGLLLAL